MRHYTSFLIALLLLTSCTPHKEAMNCNEFANLRAQIGRGFTQDALRAWIRATYPESQESLREDTVDGKSVFFQWGDPDHTYYLMTLKEHTLEGVVLGGIKATVGETIACLGQPDRYAYYQSPGVSVSFASLDVLFSTSGVGAHGAKSLSLRPDRFPKVDATFPIDRFTFIYPGASAEEFLRDFFAGESSEQRALWLKRFHPWPEKWEDITIEVRPIDN